MLVCEAIYLGPEGCMPSMSTQAVLHTAEKN